MNEHMISGANVALDLIKGWTDRQSYLLIVLLIKNHTFVEYCFVDWKEGVSLLLK